MNRSCRIRWSWLLGLALIAGGSSARADLTWTVNLDTSQLAANYSQPFGLDFELLGGNGNTVTLSNFSFGTGGTAGPGAAFTTAGASGDLGGSVVLNDSANFLVDFNQQFTPGGALSFNVDSTLVAPPSGGFPDTFSMVIFYGYDPNNGFNPSGGPAPSVIPTQDPTGANTFLTINIGGPGNTTAAGYSSADGSIPITVTPTSAVPELSSGITMLFGLLSLAGASIWRRRPVH
jgi:hypothetical protein